MGNKTTKQPKEKKPAEEQTTEKTTFKDGCKKIYELWETADDQDSDIMKYLDTIKDTTTQKQLALFYVVYAQTYKDTKRPIIETAEQSEKTDTEIFNKAYKKTVKEIEIGLTGTPAKIEEEEENKQNADEIPKTTKPRIKYYSYSRLTKQQRNDLFNKELNQHIQEYKIKARTKAELKREIKKILNKPDVKQSYLYIYDNHTRTDLFKKGNPYFKYIKTYTLTINTIKDNNENYIIDLYENNRRLYQDEQKEVNKHIENIYNLLHSGADNEQIKEYINTINTKIIKKEVNKQYYKIQMKILEYKQEKEQ